ncbi:hypothetical protein MPTK1_5g21890 [Marchantia polymorpha subsp. ruderalis]|uniref:Uncharacterized protein n=2 Tax=Marchantia polymorpha TaxID=3197 RepID=A0AAF6BKX7_MARPO|nr:hypothetical protein MARPO_0106s0010 [Marchantia polymorpha]PTQ31808.1 hypothetical protein MARPO_0106s0010 [Marchantia polymorpha]BBN12661.1 hypothetical protein Mp_5g21890 [Marchantia polymorpha subsp. ruderalis]|eukprot:PTQ31807.1 hypothetical protein MARPO_0106s0010 [Marchantia polymorpha]
MPDGFFVTMEKSERESICRDAVLAVLENNWESFASKLNDDMDCSAQSKMEMVAPVLASMCALTSSSPATWWSKAGSKTSCGAYASDYAPPNRFVRRRHQPQGGSAFDSTSVSFPFRPDRHMASYPAPGESHHKKA